jgi:hypothetical protein
VQEACKALGVGPEHLFASKVYEDRVVLVTVGGHKGSYYPGKKNEPLPRYKVTGQGGPPPEKPVAPAAK